MIPSVGETGDISMLFLASWLDDSIKRFSSLLSSTSGLRLFIKHFLRDVYTATSLLNGCEQEALFLYLLRYCT